MTLLKRFISLSLVFGLTTVVSAKPSDAETFEEASTLAKETGKPIMLVFTGKQSTGEFWCPPCLELDKAVFQSREFQTWSEENVVLLEVILPTKEWPSEAMKTHNLGLSEKYEIEFVPTVIFTDADGNQIGSNPSKDGVVAWLREASTILESKG